MDDGTRIGAQIMRFANPRRDLLGATQALVTLLRTGDAPRIVMICGVEGGEGATTISWNLAQAIAQEFSERVCLVRILEERPDGPVGEPAQAAGGGDVIDAFLSQRDLVAALDHGLRESLAHLSAKPLIYLVDGPPLLGSLEAYRLCGEVDGIVLVVEAERTTGAAIDAARAIIANCRCRILGAVLNKRRRRLPSFVAGLFGGEFRPRPMPQSAVLDSAADRLT